VDESFLYGLGRGLARNLAGSLASDTVEHCEQTHLGNREKAILIDGAFWIQTSIADLSDFEIHMSRCCGVR